MDYQTFKIERLDPISPTFCAVKWLRSDFYLHTGSTSSCHFPPPDKIDFDLVEENINWFNNTEEKLQQRREMLEGKQPEKCSNCWQVENAKTAGFSDRVFDSYDYSSYDFKSFTDAITQKPALLSVAFDTLCNFKCTYCDATQSSSWASDLKQNGPYTNIVGDPRFTYQRLGTKNLVSDLSYVNKKFIEYFLSAKDDVKVLQCVGGEPTTSPNFWNFIDTIVEHELSHIILTVTTNLSNRSKLEKLVSLRKTFNEIIFCPSIENIGSRAEFVRGGLVWNEFEENLIYLLNNDFKVNLLSTVSNLALDGFVDFVRWYLDLHKKYPKLGLSIHRVHHPNFQATTVLPKQLKYFYMHQLNELTKETNSISVIKTNEQIKNLILVLNEAQEDQTALKNAVVFFKEYARRNNFNMKDIFSPEFMYWINYESSMGK